MLQRPLRASLSRDGDAESQRMAALELSIQTAECRKLADSGLYANGNWRPRAGTRVTRKLPFGNPSVTSTSGRSQGICEHSERPIDYFGKASTGLRAAAKLLFHQMRVDHRRLDILGAHQRPNGLPVRGAPVRTDAGTWRPRSGLRRPGSPALATFQQERCLGDRSTLSALCT
jgi:hypothetical protein